LNILNETISELNKKFKATSNLLISRGLNRTQHNLVKGKYTLDPITKDPNAYSFGILKDKTKRRVRNRNERNRGVVVYNKAEDMLNRIQNTQVSMRCNRDKESLLFLVKNLTKEKKPIINSIIDTKERLEPQIHDNNIIAFPKPLEVEGDESKKLKIVEEIDMKNSISNIEIPIKSKRIKDSHIILQINTNHDTRINKINELTPQRINQQKEKTHEEIIRQRHTELKGEVKPKQPLNLDVSPILNESYESIKCLQENAKQNSISKELKDEKKSICGDEFASEQKGDVAMINSGSDLISNHTENSMEDTTKNIKSTLFSKTINNLLSNYLNRNKPIESINQSKNSKDQNVNE